LGVGKPGIGNGGVFVNQFHTGEELFVTILEKGGRVFAESANSLEIGREFVKWILVVRRVVVEVFGGCVEGRLVVEFVDE